ncbi:enolase [Hydrogenimonas sp.]|nr:enolase [Hydrogenimonas sp.]
MGSCTIENLRAIEVLDSRGNPTVRVFVSLEDGTRASASVPSGASRGENEAVELRDGDADRYGGKGVLKACRSVNEVIAPQLRGLDASEQAMIDRLMIELDGTENKSRLGANAILGVSMAVAKAAAQSEGSELYRYIGGSEARRVPVPCMNILNGGEHADNSVDFQEFMAVPHGAPSFSEGLRYVAETFHTLKKILESKGYATSVGDEGGFAPNLKSNEEAVELIIEAVERSGYEPGVDISIAIDSAATSFCTGKKGHYDLRWSGAGRMSSDDLIELAQKWVQKYPIILWEDPLAEEDWEGFAKFTDALGDKIEVVGDDIFVTNTKFITRGIEEGTANASLIKLNQIGTVTETVDAVRLCLENGWRAFLSHRSGETADTFLADFAVAMGSGHLKSGSASRSERLAKYNRLLEIEDGLGSDALYYWKRP